MNAVTMLWLLTLANTALGLAFSRATEASIVRVSGDPPSDRSRVERELQSIREIPCMRVHRARLETIIQAGEEVERCHFRQNVFGRAVLTITPRVAVATVAGQRGVMLSNFGRTFLASSANPKLPTIQLPASALAANLAIAGPTQTGAIASLCQRIPRELPATPWIVRLDERGVLCLVGPKSVQVVLGDAHRLDEKLEGLEAILSRSPGILSEVRELNLSSPDHPMIVPLEEKKK